MRSIRAQLLVWLVPSFLIISLLACSALFLSEKRRLESSIDNELVELVRLMKITLKRPVARFRPPPRIEQDFSANLKSKLDTLNSGYYFQAWNENGETIRKSLSLEQQQLTFLQKNTPIDTIVTQRLNDEEEIRVLSFSLNRGPRVNTVDASFAVSLNKVNQQLSTLAQKLVLGGFISCLTLSIILILVIRRAFVPVQALTEQVNKVEAGTLDNRLDKQNVPTEILPLVDRVNQLLTRLEKSFLRERQFNSDLAHELRTPLAAIRTTSEVALKWPEQSSIEDYQYIAQSSAQLQRTIDSLLSLARIEHAGATTVNESVDLLYIVEECLALHSNHIQTRRLSVQVDINRQHNLVIDANLLRIIVVNLISNATEYAPNDSEVIIRSGNKKSIIEVINKAPNLTNENLLEMFDRLWRKDTSRTGTSHAGLGLCVAQSAAQAMSLKLRASLDDDANLHMTLFNIK